MLEYVVLDFEVLHFNVSVHQNLIPPSLVHHILVVLFFFLEKCTNLGRDEMETVQTVQQCIEVLGKGNCGQGRRFVH